MRKFHVTSAQLDGENGNSFMALDGDIHSSFNLKYSATIPNVKADTKTITTLVNSTNSILMDVYAIDSQKKETKIGVVNSVFSKMSIPTKLRSNIEAFRLQSTKPIKVHEVILQ